MKKRTVKYLIQIDAEIGTKKQEELFVERVNMLMGACKNYTEDAHKLNKMIFKIFKNSNEKDPNQQ